jgi:hypothetical protein
LGRQSERASWVLSQTDVRKQISGKKGKGHVEETELEKSFDKILMDAVDEALLSLGENVETSIYFHLDDLFKIKKQEIPFRINDFSFALAQIFGLGAQSLEIMFMKNLRSKIRADPQRLMGELIVPGTTFEEYVCLMKKIYEDKMTIAEKFNTDIVRLASPS